MTASLQPLLREALLAALKARDGVAVSALRSTLAAIGNAEAVALPNDSRAGPIEQSPLGVAGSDVARRELTGRDVEQLVHQEISERAAAARQYESTGQHARAERLRAEAAVLAAVVAAHDRRR